MNKDSRYTIEYGERRLGSSAGEEATAMSRKLPWYFLREKEGASHSFLQLRDDQGNVVQQIHGSGFSTYSGQLAPSIDKRTREAAKDASMRANFTLYSNPVTDDNPVMKLFAVVGDESHGMLNFLSRPDTNPRVLFSGTKEEVLEKWKKALCAAHDINHANLPFVGYAITQPGQSCNTVTSSLIRAMGLEHNFYSPHVRAGYGRSVTGVFTTKSEEAMSLEALTKKAMEPVQPFMAEAHERFSSVAEQQAKLGYLL